MTARYTAHFTPQAWIRDYAIDVDPEGPQTWDCTAEIATMPARYAQQVIQDGHDPDDWLKGDPNAPEWVREWSGPFEIHVSGPEPDGYRVGDGGTILPTSR